MAWGARMRRWEICRWRSGLKHSIEKRDSHAFISSFCVYGYEQIRRLEDEVLRISEEWVGPLSEGGIKHT